MTYPTDKKLAAALLEFRTQQGLTNSVLGQRFGESATFISKYLNDKLDRDPKDFAERAWNVLTALKGKLDDATNIFENSVTKSIAGRIDMARRTQQVFLIVGDAGEGKSCGGRLFAENNPGTIYHELSTAERTDKQVAASLFEKLERRKDWKGDCSYYKFLVRQLRGSHRVIILDEAHLLESSGRQLAFNLCRDTGCPVGLFGNPEIEDKIRKSPQHLSRIGVKGQPMLTPKEVPANALRVATQFSSAAFAESISDLVAFVGSKPGKLRAVRITTILAYELSAKNGTDPRTSFRDAHTNLVRDYHLPTD